MPRTVPSAHLAHIGSHASTVATCWQIIRTDGVVMGFTSHSKDIEIDGVLYVARTGYTPTAVASNSNLSVDNLDLDGIVAGNGINKEDIRAGVYDYADVWIFEVNYRADPPSIGRVLRRGNVGEITLKDGLYVTEVRGLAQKLTRNFIRSTMPECDAQVYDDRCRADPEPHKNEGTITSVISRHQFNIELTGTSRESDYFSGGKVTFLSGSGEGRTLDIKVQDGELITLFLSSPWNLQEGDTFVMLRGCDRKFETCKLVFDNILNFRGFPKMPGKNHITKTAKTKASEPADEDSGLLSGKF